MKLRNILFLLLEAGIATAGIVHTAIRYFRIAQNLETSFPAETAFFSADSVRLGIDGGRRNMVRCKPFFQTEMKCARIDENRLEFSRFFIEILRMNK
jgi:hypothetical protein